MKTVYALLWGLFLTSTTWAQCVEPLTPPAPANWSGMHFHSASAGWLIGGQGQVFQTANGGQSWSQADPRTAVDIQHLTFLDQATGWLVGKAGVIRRTTDGGNSWQQQFSPIGADLNSVDFAFSNLGLVAGDCGALLRTINGGATWSWADAGTPNNLEALLWVNTQIALAAGEGGVVLRSTDGGQAWELLPGTGTSDHYALEALGAQVWLSGEGGTYYSEDAGENWEWVDARRFRTLDADGTGALVGAGMDGLVSVSNDHGQTWQDLAVLPGVDWSAVVLTGNQSGYLAGQDGQVVAFRWLNAMVNGPSSVCEGSVVQLSGSASSGNPSYSWSGPGGFLETGLAVSLSPSLSGWYTFSAEEAGCMTQDSLFLEVLPTPDVDLGVDLVLCEGESTVLSGPAGNFIYDWSVGSSMPEIEVATAGVYSLTVAAEGGCTATDTVSVDIQANSAFLLDTLLCSGTSLEVNGTFYDEFNPAGTEVLPGGAANGCDSVITVQIEFSITEPITLDTSVCNAAFPFVYAGLEVGSPGNYFVQTTNADGCPQMIFLNVQGLPGYDLSVQDTFCEGGLYVWNGAILTTPGMYTATFLASDGCDSTVTLNLAEQPASATNLGLTICDGETVEIGSTSFGETGFYEIELTNAVGCDSIVNLDLIVLPNDTLTESAGICQGEAFSWEGMMLGSSGQYQVELVNSNGCDSIRRLELEVFLNPELFIVDTLPDNGTGSGAAVLDVNQGQAPFEVNWSNGGSGLVQTGLSAGAYDVTVTDANDCTDTLAVTVPMATGVTEAEQGRVEVWPNPANQQLWVRLPASWKASDARIVLYDLLGQPHQSWTGGDTRGALGLSVQGGAYLLSVAYRGHRQIKKVIVAN